jgi:hypothetical protein
MSRTLPKRKPIAQTLISQVLIKYRLLWLILVAFFLLSGCVRDDISLRFSDANHGRFVQQIRIAQPTTGLENVMAIAWLERLEQQTEKLGGWVQHPSTQDSVLTIPFFNAKDLEAKFNRLFQEEFQPSSQVRKTKPSEPLPTIASHLKMRSGNWILLQRMVLNYELDLRSLNSLFVKEKMAIDPREVLSLEFRLSTPWGARVSEDQLTPMRHSQGRQLIWKLEPGEINHIAAIFWVPSPVGIGTMLIVLLVLLGILIKAPPLKAQPFKDLTNA